MRIRHHASSSVPIVPTVISASGGLGGQAGLHTLQGHADWFGSELAQDLCISVIGMDSDQATKSIALPRRGGLPAVAFPAGKQFITRPQRVQDLRRAGLRDPLVAPIAKRAPADFDGDTAAGTAKSVPIARLVFTAEHGEFQNFLEGAFAEVRAPERIARLRDAGLNPALDTATVFINLFHALASTGNSWSRDLAVMAGSIQRQQGFKNARRIAIIGIPDSAGDELQNRANILGFLKDIALSHKYPGRYRSVGFGRRYITLDEPLYHAVFVVGPTNSRIVAQSRDEVAFRMARVAMSLTVGGIAAAIASRAQDARRHLSDLPDAKQRFLARCGFAALRFDHASLRAAASDEFSITVSRFLRLGAA